MAELSSRAAHSDVAGDDGSAAQHGALLAAEVAELRQQLETADARIAALEADLAAAEATAEAAKAGAIGQVDAGEQLEQLRGELAAANAAVQQVRGACRCAAVVACARPLTV